jgi:Glycosyl transferase family 2
VKVVGLYIVRNEADIMETNLRYHLAGVIDEAIVIDNGSTDGTLERLAELSRDLPIHVASEPGTYDQSARATRLARFASQSGADWVLPIDADEFWAGTGVSFHDVLGDTPSAVRALFAEVVNFVQSRDVLTATPRSLLTMTMRPPAPIGPVEQTSTMVREDRIAFVEIAYAPKCIYRTAPDLVVYDGNHAPGVEGGVATDRIVCLHAPLRARSVFTQKLDQGRRRMEEGSPPEASWHVQRWWHMAREHRLDAEWAANSYQDGSLLVAGQRRPLVADDRLRAAVAPHLSGDDWPASDETAPAPSAFALALDTIPGRFGELDVWVLVELDRMQRAAGLRGAVVALHPADPRSAVMLGHVAGPEGRFLMLGEPAEAADGPDGSSFGEQYARFHAEPAEVRADSGGDDMTSGLVGACRLVHLNGGRTDAAVRRDLALAACLLAPGGVIALGDAPAAWGKVLGSGFVPLLVTDETLYGTWQAPQAEWAAAIGRRAGARPEVDSVEQTLGRWTFLRLRDRPGPQAVEPDRLVRIPTLDELAGSDQVADATAVGP